MSFAPPYPAGLRALPNLRVHFAARRIEGERERREG